ncbi:MAG: hypothetical protein HY561_09715 [Gemmatimonadetes bacterium]|nr:hypothetical protein [Gemmatimonadota bacterium]
MRIHRNAVAHGIAGLLASLSVAGRAQAQAQEQGWTVRIEAMRVSPRGHDPHVLTIHEVDLDTQDDRKSAVTLDTRSSIGYRAMVQYTRSAWTWGATFFWLDTSQTTPNLTAAAGGTIDEASFEIADRRFTSSDPGEVLFYRVLEDTDINPWTLDLYGTRTLIETAAARLALQLGVRFGDFDNDYRAAVGIENAGGTRLDASSNYPRMTGPLAGLTGTVQVGPSAIDGYLGHSVILGEVELDGSARDFTGPFSESVPFFARETLHTTQDIAIPITEARINWSVRLIDHLSLGAGVHASTWWDVPVPPGVIPIQDGDESLHENTIVLLAILGGLEIRF